MFPPSAGLSLTGCLLIRGFSPYLTRSPTVLPVVSRRKPTRVVTEVSRRIVREFPLVEEPRLQTKVVARDNSRDRTAPLRD